MINAGMEAAPYTENISFVINLTLFMQTLKAHFQIFISYVYAILQNISPVLNI